GETIQLDSDDPDRYYLAKGVDTENYDSWDNDRAKWHDQAVATASTFNGNGGLTYGVSDLSMYGSYFDVPGYGYMWRPSSVGYGWDPFADGYWVSYPGFGYTFVSSYPWGWAPYRYGYWQFVNGYGWCWAPGSNWNYWQAVPPVRNIPPGYRPPRVPHHGPAVLIVNNGSTAPAPTQGRIIDNDTLEHRLPHARKITDQSGLMVRQRPAATAAPAQGLVTSGPTASPQAPITIPETAVVPTPRPTDWHSGGRWQHDGGEVSRGGTSNQPSRAASPAGMGGSAASAPQPPAQTVAPPMPTQAPPAHVTQPPRIEPRGAPAMNPRMESHAPSMRMDHPMSSPASMSRPMPSMSSGGGPHMAAPSMGGGGMHAGGGGGGGGGGASHGSHR
ncbi:MAG TPA: DUF6600 domain-containing protein, partial [Terriglobales bacterium]|nr:DUF6600 domain-containing protein [Terriglobales bacterium]